MRRKLGIAVGAAAVVLGVAATAVAGHVTGKVKSYTGCLVPGDGVVIKVSEGNAPASACTGRQTQVHFSSGDITKITAGAGLAGGGDNGEVTLSLNASHRLPQGCSGGQVAKWNSGSSSWVCAADNDTTYSASAPLTLTGTSFGIAADAFARKSQSCPTEQFATGIDSTGSIVCQASVEGLRLFANTQAAWVGIPATLVYTQVVTLDVLRAATRSSRPAMSGGRPLTSNPVASCAPARS